ncbi:MAG: OmpA family protein [Deltaproteobacteria bacterium]|jgi:chemotaxis protein MotB|nr:OmpA family protein [Deltaproteobacteria bacterium]
MARKEKASGGEEGPAWLITFSDLMTLLLTFFVLLVSMAVIDERSKLVVLGSVSSSFGLGPANFNPKSPEKLSSKVEPGAMKEPDMAPIKDMLWEDNKDDLNFQENRFVQILSINADVLYKPGQTQLSEEGKRLINKMIPQLLRIKYPLLVAGHTANRRDEEGKDYQVDFDKTKVDSTWPLSLARGQGVYRYLLRNGIPSERLSQEAFGQYHPRYPDRAPDNRLLNRRVDIVLDKRNAPEILNLERAREAPPKMPGRYLFHDFQFDLGGGRRNR